MEVKCSVFGYDDHDQTLNSINQIEAEEEEIIEEEENEEISYNVYEGLDFSKISEMSDDETIRNLCQYLEKVNPSLKNEYTGLFEGYNLIYICAESFSSLAIDERITPTLYKMANNGIVLNNYYNSFKNRRFFERKP